MFVEAVATRDAVMKPLRCDDVHLPFARELVLRSFRFRYDEMRASVLVHLAAVFAAISRQNLLDLNIKTIVNTQPSITVAAGRDKETFSLTLDSKPDAVTTRPLKMGHLWSKRNFGSFPKTIL